MTLTRYLYVKEEVIAAILTSIMERNNDASFWVFELYYSGFENETIELIWTIYYSLFAVLNPDLESYLLEHLVIKEEEEEEEEDKKNLQNIHTVIQTLLIRPYDTDVFLLHKIALYLDYDVDNAIFDLTTMSYMDLAVYIITHPADCDALMKRVCLHFVKPCWKWVVVDKMKPLVLLSKCMHFYSTASGRRKCRRFYISVPQTEFKQYETVETPPAYKILRMVCLPVDPCHYLSLFETPRHRTMTALKMYHSHWLYYASGSPIWRMRIVRYGGVIGANAISFPVDGAEESFYDKYDYEPDEQTMEVQYRNMQPIQAIQDWVQFIRKGLFPKTDGDQEMISLLPIQCIRII